MAQLLFKTNFGGDVAVEPYSDPFHKGNRTRNGSGGDVRGYDFNTSYYGGIGRYIHTFNQQQAVAVDHNLYYDNKLETMIGPTGASQQVMNQALLKIPDNPATASQTWYEHSSGNGTFPSASDGDIYMSSWQYYPSDFDTQIGENSYHTIHEFKTYGTDLRIIWGTLSRSNSHPTKAGKMYWRFHIDSPNGSTGPTNDDHEMRYNYTLEVPLGEWFKVETFFHRSSGHDARVWFAINGQTIWDTMFPMMGHNAESINRHLLWGVYTNENERATTPVEHWISDLEVWDGFPNGAPSFVDTGTSGPEP